jgi:hypothetical protein
MLEETVFIQTDDGWRIQLTGANPDGWPVAGDFVIKFARRESAVTA